MDEGWAATQTGMRDMKLATTTELSAETSVTIPPSQPKRPASLARGSMTVCRSAMALLSFSMSRVFKAAMASPSPSSTWPRLSWAVTASPLMLPATSARFWARAAGKQMVLSAAIGVLASYAGLLFSYHANVPASPAIILCAGAVYLMSVLFGRYGGVMQAVRQAHGRRRSLAQISQGR